MSINSKQEKIIKKVKGLLAIAKDHNKDEESQSAFLLAQRLMIQYSIDKRDVAFSQDEAEPVGTESVTVYKKLFWWERELGSIISSNFRVKMYYTEKGSGHKTKIVFYGFGGDLELAKEMYFLAYEVLLFHTKEYIESYYLNNWEVDRTRYMTESIKASYIRGFLCGLEERFKEQVSVLTESYEVMVLVPKEVQESYEEHTKDFGKYSTVIPELKSPEAYSNGFEKAKQIDFTRSTVHTDYSSLVGKYIKFNQGVSKGLYGLITSVDQMNDGDLSLVVFNETQEQWIGVYEWTLPLDYGYSIITKDSDKKEKEKIELFEELKKGDYSNIKKYGIDSMNAEIINIELSELLKEDR